MSDVIFADLGLPEPHIHLGVGSGTHGEQTARVLIAYEAVLMQRPPDLVVVVGDVNSTIAATLAATKLGIKVAHLEAGLRSFDRRMPEEINRLATDVLADILWTPSDDAVVNLRREGVAPEKIEPVGNIMIDSLEMLRDTIVKQQTHAAFGVKPGDYGVVTLHRPSNVDDPSTLAQLATHLIDISETLPLVFPIHPRTRARLGDGGLLDAMNRPGRLLLPEPLSYMHFMNLVFNCRLVITDSGGIQEETTHLGIPCLTVRENTERPITVSHGTNQLVGLSELKDRTAAVLRRPAGEKPLIPMWDGKTADRIVALLRIRAGAGLQHAQSVTA
jgi:UDP-N-acetylglucosamine 2-epimerase (non-hydrolysing)